MGDAVKNSGHVLLLFAQANRRIDFDQTTVVTSNARRDMDEMARA
jgi:hypothetical protein